MHPSTPNKTRGVKGKNVFCLFRDNDSLGWVGLYKSARDLHFCDFSANVYMYIKGKINTLNGYVIVTVEKSFVESNTMDEVIKHATAKAKMRQQRAQLTHLNNAQIAKLSNEQVGQIIEIINQ